MTKIDIGKLAHLTLRDGAGMGGEDRLCVMQAVAFITGETATTKFGGITDHPECVDPLLTSLGIWINDHMSDAARQALKACIPNLIDTRADGFQAARAFLTADFAVHTLLPMMLAKTADAGLIPDVAAIPAITDRASMHEAAERINVISTNWIASNCASKIPFAGMGGYFPQWRALCNGLVRAVAGHAPLSEMVVSACGEHELPAMLAHFDRLLALGNTRLADGEVGDLVAHAAHDDEVAARQAIFLDVAADLGYTPFPDPAPTSAFMCLEN